MMLLVFMGKKVRSSMDGVVVGLSGLACKIMLLSRFSRSRSQKNGTLSPVRLERQADHLLSHIPKLLIKILIHTPVKLCC